MKSKVSPVTVGAFVIGAFALLTVALLTFGGINFFAKPQRFAVYFDESVHGLDNGSPVKLRGVRVGRVVGINIRYDQAKNESVVAVICELNRESVTDTKGGVFNVASRVELQKLVDRGLRAQLGVQGLATGLLFVELDFVDPVEYPPTGPASDSQYVVVPAKPSSIAELTASISEILARVRKVDFEGLSVELKKLLADTRKEVVGIDLKGLLDQWKKTGASVDALVKTPEIKETIVNLNGAITEVRATLAKLDTQVGTNGEQLTVTLKQAKETLESFNAAATGARKFIASQSGLGEEATRALGQLAEAAAAVQRLADFLERNPQALISGRPLPK
ncbi:MAG TPA: MlaD family protein [Opitutaceae bacterium]|nr:MlaD family protein [Opitutaceae bacterium]